MILNINSPFIITVILITTILGCISEDRYQHSITVNFSDSDEFYQDVILTTEGDTIYRGQMPRHRQWAQKTLHSVFANYEIEFIRQGWSCLLQDSLVRENSIKQEYNFSVYENAFKQASGKMNFTNIEVALNFFVDNFFIDGLFITTKDEKWQYCEKLYRSKLMELLETQNEYNSYGLRYQDLGFDTCQIEELLNIDLLEKELLSNQYIISPSGCFLSEKGNEINNKPYFLLTFETVNKNYELKIELLNKLCFYNWLSL